MNFHVTQSNKNLNPRHAVPSVLFLEKKTKKNAQYTDILLSFLLNQNRNF